MNSGSPLRVAFLPVYRNPYQHLLTAALAEHEVAVELLDGMPDRRWLEGHRGRVRILHLHWLSGLYMNRWRTPSSCLAFVRNLDIARRLGYDLVWTAHNTMPHRNRLQILHRVMRRRVLDRATTVITHCAEGQRELLRLFPASRNIEIIPMGNYCGVFPATVSRTEARQRLALCNSGLTMLFLANITPTKGLEELIPAFRHAACAEDVLMIAGRNRSPALVAKLRRLAGDDPRIVLQANEIPDHEMQYFLRAADLMVAPFRRILSSSSVMLGLSWGLPIVAPAMGCLPELVGEKAGILYPPHDPLALTRALREITARDLKPMSVAAAARAALFRWDEIAARTAEVYRRCQVPPQ